MRHLNKAKTALLLIAVALVLPISAFAGPIYVFRESDGSIRFTNRTPPPNVKAEVFTARAGSVSWIRYGSGSPRMNETAKARMKQYETLIRSAALLNQIDVALIKAVIHAESAGDSRAISRAGAIGLMQLMPETARDLGVRPFVAQENIEGGSRHLARLIRSFGGNLVNAIAAYNAGEEAVRRYGGIPPYLETKTYVRRVLALKDTYSLPQRG